jgi:hypothetical protein
MLILGQHSQLRCQQHRVLGELAVSEGVVEHLVFLVDHLGVEGVPATCHHTELDIGPYVSWAGPTRVLKEESDISRVHRLPAVRVHLQTPPGLPAMHHHHKLVRVHGLARSEAGLKLAAIRLNLSMVQA